MAKPSRKSSGIAGGDSSIETLELELFLESLYRHYGYDFRNYQLAAVKGPVREFMLSARVPTISRLQERMLREPILLEKFLKKFSPSTGPLFSDTGFFRAFRSRIIPILKTYPFARIWHIGCSGGEEAYAMAIMLHEQEFRSRFRIYATDLSGQAVKQARRGAYSADKLAEYQNNYTKAGSNRSLSDYLRVTGNRLLVKPALRKQIVFCEHNLATDESFNEFQVIVCRDVLHNFNRTLRARVDRLIYESLSRLGVLVLGDSDSIDLLPRSSCYTPLDEAGRLYQKNGNARQLASA